MPQIHKPGQA